MEDIDVFIGTNFDDDPVSLCLNFFHLHVVLARKPDLYFFFLFIQTNSSKFPFVSIQFYLSLASGKWVSTKTVLFYKKFTVAYSFLCNVTLVCLVFPSLSINKQFNLMSSEDISENTG